MLLRFGKLELIVTLALLLLLALVAGDTSPKRVSLKVRAVDSKGGVHEGIAFSGHRLRITANVPKSSDNRILDTAIDCSSGFFRSWSEALDGENALYSRESTTAPMPSGYCDVLVQVSYVDRKQQSGIGYYMTEAQMCFVGGDVTCQREN